MGADLNATPPDDTGNAAEPAGARAAAPPRAIILTRTERWAAVVLGIVVTLIGATSASSSTLSPVTVEVAALPAPEPYHLVVDINSATWRRIALVPGLGEKRARSIVEERDANGPFVAIDDLARRIRGIGPATVERLRQWLVVRTNVSQTLPAGGNE
ncbi:MAG: ComEA family DNA-binding protein [Planctomycetota bacterium]